MYVFEAQYENICTQEIRKEEILVEDLLDEKEIFMYATGVAYDKTKNDEIFSSIEFIAG